MTDNGNRLFAADCAERAQTYPKNYAPDPRTLAAIQAARDYTNGLISAHVLKTYQSAAYDAADAKREHRNWQIETLKDLIIEHADRPTRREMK